MDGGEREEQRRMRMRKGAVEEEEEEERMALHTIGEDAVATIRGAIPAIG